MDVGCKVVVKHNLLDIYKESEKRIVAPNLFMIANSGTFCSIVDKKNSPVDSTRQVFRLNNGESWYDEEYLIEVPKYLLPESQVLVKDNLDDIYCLLKAKWIAGTGNRPPAIMDDMRSLSGTTDTVRDVCCSNSNVLYVTLKHSHWAWSPHYLLPYHLPSVSLKPNELFEEVFL